MGRLDQMMFTVPPALLKFISPDLPKPLRLNAARGTLPIPPRDLVMAVFALSRDSDAEIAELSKKTLVDTPAAILKPLLADANTHPLILHFFALCLPSDSELQETVALNKATDDETILFQATLTNKKLVDIISNNQIRILRNPRIVDMLGENPLCSPAILDRIIKFMELEAKQKPKEAKPSAAKTDGMEVEIEEVTEEDIAASAGEAEVGTVTMGEEPGVVENAWAKMTFNTELLQDKELKDEKEKEEEERSLSGKIQNMNISSKIKLAMMGNMSARSILIRDSNKLVASAVLKSPRITDSEIETVSKSRSVSEEIIRTIAADKEWTRTYQIKLNLVNNSKTPIGDALRFINHMHDKDLGMLAKSKNVPQPVTLAARKLMNTRAEAGKAKKKGK
jgi:hypothetical protein